MDLSSKQHETHENTFTSLKEGTKLNITFNSKRRAKSGSKLVGLYFCGADQSIDLIE